MEWLVCSVLTGVKELKDGEQAAFKSSQGSAQLGGASGQKKLQHNLKL